MHEEPIVFEGGGDIARLAASGALHGSVAGFAQPRGPDLIRRTEALEAWCALRAGHGLWQGGRAPDPDPGLGVDFASSDYLSLAAHPAVRKAGAAALLEAGPHSAGPATLPGPSRLSLALEASLAARLKLEHVILFPSGWSAAFGAITALVHERDYVVLDALLPPPLHQAARAATGKVVAHRHLDTGHVRELLAAIRARDPDNGILVVTRGLFDTDADLPDLPLMQHLCREYGATLLVDVSHDLGARGPGGSGTLGEQAMLGKADIVTGSFAKTFASNGGFVASGARAVKRQLEVFAGPHGHSSAMSPVQAACVLEALRIASSPEGDALRAALLHNVLALRAHLAETGMRCLGVAAGVVPLWIGSEQVARLAGRTLAREGVFAELVESPGAARLRLQVMAGHSPGQLRQGARAIGAAVAGAGAALGIDLGSHPPGGKRRRW